MNSFKILDISGSMLSRRENGREIRQKIKDLVSENGAIELDMQNITSVSPSFLEEAIVMLVVDYGKEDFKKKIFLKNLNESVKGLMNSMLTRKMQPHG